MIPTLDPRVTVGAVSLTVSDLERSLRYYQNNIGLTLQANEGQSAVLGAGTTPLLRLYGQPGARHFRGVTGLYHFAIRLPSRHDLARMIRHLADTQTRIDGASDHLVSEALYLSDPDGHGIEIYRDRPREGWYNEQGYLKMDTIQLDFEGIMGELTADESPWEGVHTATVMGHIHLHVAHIRPAVDFYRGVIGLERPPLNIDFPSAAFLGIDGYHHHLGLNTWAGVGAPPPPNDAARLLSYEILFPDSAALTPVLDRLTHEGIPIAEEDGAWSIKDPSMNGILLRTVP